MAFMAAGAHAEPKFLYLEGGVTKTLAVESLPTISTHKEGVLLVPNKNLEIKCPEVESDTTAPVELLGTNKAPNGGIAHGHLKFKKCTAWTIKPLEVQPKCVPRTPGLAAGEILAGGLAHLILHPANNTMVLFEPLGGLTKPFALIEFTEFCALFEEASVTGSLVAECGELNGSGVFVGGNCATHRVTQLLQSVSEALNKELKDELLFGINPASIDGIAAVKFGKPCEGCAWGADAE
jgi:hypothetical protein